MKTKTIQNKKDQSKGRFLTIKTKNRGNFVGRIKNIGNTYITFDRFSGERGSIKLHKDNILSVS